jgi:hypothetical protein
MRYRLLTKSIVSNGLFGISRLFSGLRRLDFMFM